MKDEITTLTTWLKNTENQRLAMAIYDVLPSKFDRTKSEKRAKSYRRTGNHIFTSCSSADDFENVFSYYGKAIAHAPAKSAELALAYSNLSAVLFKLEKHAECLQAIDCCFKAGYPEETKFKIYLRKIECLKVIDEPQKAKEAYKEALAWINKNQTIEGRRSDMKTRLEECYKSQIEVKKSFTEEEIDQLWKKFSIKSFNKEIPGVSSAVALEYSESLGRHLVATRDIRPGELIFKDRPYSLICAENSRYQCCWKCSKTLTNCIACDCCEHVIFCSVKCKEEAWNLYHHIECELLPLFLYSETESEYINKMISALRILLLAIKEYGSVQKLRKAVKKMEQSKDPRTKGFVNGKLPGDKYVGFVNLKCFDFVGKCDEESEGARDIISAIMFHIATTTTLLGEKIKPDWTELYKNKDFVFAISIFIKHLNILMTNQFTVTKPSPCTGTSEMLSVSIPISLINHSCLPNVVALSTTAFIKVFALLPIKKGDQILMSYLGEETFDRETRQEIFKVLYDFTCTCDACINDWSLTKNHPEIEELPGKYEPILSSTMKAVEPCIEAVKTRLDVKHGQNIRKHHKFLMIILKRLSETIEKLSESVPMPSVDVKELQDTLVLFFMKLHNGFM